MFTQQINIDNVIAAQTYEIMKICNEHPECKECPLKEQDIQLQSGLVRCETGRDKQK